MLQTIAIAYAFVTIFWIGYNVGAQASVSTTNIPLTIIPPLLWPLLIIQIILAYTAGIYVGDEYKKVKRKFS